MRRLQVFVFIGLTLVAVALSACASKPAAPVVKDALFFDDFSNSNSGWTKMNTDSGVIEYANKQYRFFVKKQDTLLIANPGKSFPGDVSIEVDSRKFSGSNDNYFGVICHYKNPQNYYLFLITSDGFSGIIMRKDGQDTLVSPGLKFLKMVGINMGNSRNHIRVDCIGEKLVLFANGKQVSLAYDKSLTGGDVGLAVRSPQFQGDQEVQFDNFVVNKSVNP